MGRVTDEWTPEGKRFMKELRELAELEVRVGYQREEEEDNSDNEDNKKKPADLVDIALYNEFGTGHIPSRPFMRDSVDKHIAAINHVLLVQKDALLEGATARKILKEIGSFQQDLIQTEIEQGDFVANAKTTIERKKKKGPGPYIPLVDDGNLKNSVHYYIVKKGSMD